MSIIASCGHAALVRRVKDALVKQAVSNGQPASDTL